MKLDVVRLVIRTEMVRIIKKAGFRTRHKKRKGGGTELRPLYRKFNTTITITSVRPFEHIAAKIKMGDDRVTFESVPSVESNATVTRTWGKTHFFFYDDPKTFDKFQEAMNHLFKTCSSRNPHANVR